MSLQQAWQEMIGWMKEYAGEQPFILILAFLSLIYLFCFNKDIRVRIIVPVLFFVPIVINPLLYRIIYYKIRYWRLFWMIPDALLIGMAFIDLCRRIKPQWLKCVVLVLSAATIALAGKNVFLSEGWVIAPTDNPYGVSNVTREVCDAILQDNPHPRCIFIDWIYNQTRMYSGDIEQMYGRDYDGFIYPINPEIKAAADHWMKEPKDWEYLFAYAAEHNYTHVCMHADPEQKEIAKAHGFSLIAEFDWRCVFRNENIQD